ncbi:MAG: lipopolysaccharide transport periplasmic protein LptA [Deltaproteobacteria bacterium]|nr:lipopolysaccharide transport periplasmic protein LptA [Deltaproteobacteria bacterium]
MNNEKKYLFVLFILLATPLAYAENKLFSKQSDEPMEITSNRMEAFNENKLVVFSGNAMVKQGSNVLKSDKLLLYYKKEPDKKEKVGTIETERTGDLEKVEAKGNVSLTQGKRIATGDEATYFRDSAKIILTGNAVLSEGKNLIKGDKVIVYINEDRGVVESNTKKQVKAIIYPQEKKKAGN